MSYGKSIPEAVTHNPYIILYIPYFTLHTLYFILHIMNISELSIRRPVLSTVLTLIILLFGFIGYNYLGVREYPSVDNPIISVSCSYPGANADVIENQITEPLEQNINGIPGIRSLSSVSQQGSSRITVEFELSVDLETAANDVRDKVSRAQRYLPRDCDPPTVSKADADAMPILMVALQSDKRSLLELSEIADLTVKEQLQRCEQCKHLGRETLFHALVARPYQDVRLRHYPHRRKECGRQ